MPKAFVQLSHSDRRVLEQAAGLLASFSSFTRHGEAAPRLLLSEVHRTVRELHALSERTTTTPPTDLGN